VIMCVTLQHQQATVRGIPGDGRWLGKVQTELRALIMLMFAQARSRWTALLTSTLLTSSLAADERLVSGARGQGAA
jgi:hypothetical protein